MNAKRLRWWRPSESTEPQHMRKRLLASATWYKHRWDLVRTGFWFVPGVLVVAASSLNETVTQELNASFIVTWGLRPCDNAPKSYQRQRTFTTRRIEAAADNQKSDGFGAATR